MDKNLFPRIVNIVERSMIMDPYSIMRDLVINNEWGLTPYLKPGINPSIRMQLG